MMNHHANEANKADYVAKAVNVQKMHSTNCMLAADAANKIYDW